MAECNVTWHEHLGLQQQDGLSFALQAEHPSLTYMAFLLLVLEHSELTRGS